MQNVSKHKMRHSANILTLMIIMIGFSLTIIAQTNDKYKVILNRENLEKLEVYDTTVSLSYLSEVRYESLTNMQIFEGFDYPKLQMIKNDDFIELSNDSIKIALLSKPFDSIDFKVNYRTDSSLFYNSLYFREFPMEFDYPSFYPKTEISEIKLSVNDRIIKVPDKHCKDLYNPDLEKHKYGDFELFGINGYMADNGNILLTLYCGEGVGAYKVIFLFDRDGRLIKRINEPVI